MSASQLVHQGDRPPIAQALRRFSALLWRRPRVAAAMLLAPPMGWFLLVYVSALGILFLSSFWRVDEFTGEIIHKWGLHNFEILAASETYRTIALRTIGIAAAVTITDIILAFPCAYFMVRIAGPRLRATLFALVLLPLWSSYIARVYAWRLILAHDGALNWALEQFGLPPANIGFTNTAMWIVFSYIWLPFMITPIYAAIERVPGSLFEASQDLGARGFRTFRKVTLPQVVPGVIAGSIFTFSLTLGDYITPILVGGPGSSFIGNVVYSNVGIANNVPFAAAFATIPAIVMVIYLLTARRLGAFEMM
jgi:putative spermidine/putrescine transport system permease protein